MNTMITLLKDKQQIDLSEHPSLLALLHAQQRLITGIEDEISKINSEIESLQERQRLYESIGQRTVSIKATITRRKKQIAALQSQNNAASAGYVEVPDMGGEVLKTNEIKEPQWWHETLPPDTPIDVVRALKHAQDKGLFDEFRVFKPARQGTDPIVVGVAGGATFYIGSWR